MKSCEKKIKTWREKGGVEKIFYESWNMSRNEIGNSREERTKEETENSIRLFHLFLFLKRIINMGTEWVSDFRFSFSRSKKLKSSRAETEDFRRKSTLTSLEASSQLILNFSSTLKEAQIILDISS